MARLSTSSRFKLTSSTHPPDGDDELPKAKRPKQPVSTASLLNRYETGWRSASAASCAPASVRQLHLRARLDNPPDHPVSRASATATSTRSTTYVAFTATSASRPADPGDHRVQDVRVLLHQPLRRDLHEGRTPRGRSGLPAALPWRTGAGEAAMTGGWMRATYRTVTPPTRVSSSGRRSRRGLRAAEPTVRGA